MKWTNDLPDEPGIYLMSNPIVQQDIRVIQVIKIDGELQIYFPTNEQSKRRSLTKMPKRFLWYGRIPDAPHHKFIHEYPDLVI